jgi:Uma2 family endonuclease
MPTATAPHTPVSVQDYLAGELASEVRHEYVAGQVYAMVGASDRHGLIAGNLHAALHSRARRMGCQLFIADMKVRLSIAGDEVFYYPDLVLCCDPADRESYYRSRPCLIVEVLSEATERVDRREKLLAYRTVESLREYVLVAQDRRQVEVFRRGGGWEREVLAEGSLRLECLDAEVPLATIYEDIPLAS